MRPNNVLYIDKEFPYEHPLASATIQHKLFSPRRESRLVAVQYVNPTGLAGHASNFWTIDVIQSTSTLMARWSTNSDVVGQGTLGANTVVAPTLTATDADLIIPANTLVSILLTKAASAANLPIGRFCLHYKLIG